MVSCTQVVFLQQGWCAEQWDVNLCRAGVGDGKSDPNWAEVLFPSTK